MVGAYIHSAGRGRLLYATHAAEGTFGGGGMSINNSDGMVSKCCYRANSVVVQRIDIVAA